MTAGGYRAAIGALVLLAFLLRTVPLWDRVFQPGFVNFQESDAWYHVRLIRHLTENGLQPLTWDPYALYPGGQAVLVGPLFDWVAALLALGAGLGHPSARLTDMVAALLPAVLGAILVALNAALAQQLAGRAAGLLTGGMTALLPGYFLTVSSLGFTDHHVLESLLSVAILLLLQRGQALGAGAAMAGYALTFTGAAAFLAVLVGWGCCEQLRERGESWRPLAVACAVALPVALVFRHLLWMEYTAAVLAAGVLAPAAVRGVRGRRRLWAPALVCVAVAGVVLLQTNAGEIALRQLTATNPTSRTVGELQSLTHAKGFFSLEGAWEQMAGTLPLALAGLLALGSRHPLVAVWTAAAFVLAALQVRMVYYAAPMAALFGGMAAARFLGKAGPVRWGMAALLILLVALPGMNVALNPADRAGALTPEWLGALEWLREKTPEPFAESNKGYGVAAWWDFGYWITAVAHRIPLTNPAQTNAGVVASFFLAGREEEAFAAVGRDGAPRYVMVDGTLAMSARSTGRGMYLALFPYAEKARERDYVRQVLMKGEDGRWKAAVVFLPAYYQSLAVRLAAFGGQAIEAGRGAHVCLAEDGRRVRAYTLVEAPAGPAPEGCLLVGVEPLTSPVAVEAPRRMRRVYGTTSGVQIFEVLAGF
ncbi:MAG: hypothetical protein JNK87_00890 [Bryobacterales bacterium]|nr:hypothetical protein [Bryobacterales bacterium]